MSNLSRLQERLYAMDSHALLVPSTDEYLSEFAQPFARRLQWLTGFSGSTGFAVVSRTRAALFLDGRYKAQGEHETAGRGIEIIEASADAKQGWLAAHLRAGERLAVNPGLHSYPEMEEILAHARQRDLSVVELSRNPLDELWGSARPPAPASPVLDYPTDFAGVPATEKCAELCRWLGAQSTDCHIVADPEDVAWLLNVRTHDSLGGRVGGWHVVPVPLSRAVIDANGDAFWFVDAARLDPALAKRLGDTVTILRPARFEEFLQQHLAGRAVSANLRRTPHRHAAIAASVGTLRDDPVIAHRRWIKHANELQRAREGHHKDGQAVIRFLAWLQRTVRERPLTETEAAEKLAQFRSHIPGYRGMSMPLMSASGPNGAIPHYVPADGSDRVLNDHPIYWMDSGGQYYGCSTDNTVCIAVGTPSAKHIRAHTLVVKGLIALTRARFPAGTYSTQVDSFARQYLWQEGLDYGHGTGHGVGSFMNIHEGPHIRKEPGHPMAAPLVAGMIVSNEPGYYSHGDFGIRVETHMAVVHSRHPGFLEFETLSRLPIDPRLMEESLLTAAEKSWLSDYHLRVWEGYEGCFDEETSSWLRAIVDAYLSIAR